MPRSAPPFSNLAAHAYKVILMDPPWSFITYSDAGKERSADRHYVCMTLEEIAALPVGDLAADDCALFLWTTGGFLPAALDLLKGWGFTYKAFCPWVKMTKDGSMPAMGMGYIMRDCVEPCLLATRGKPKRLSRGERNVILAPRREHSRKPDEMYTKIEALYDGPYVELFARTTRPGWASWGNQKNKFDKSLVA